MCTCLCWCAHSNRLVSVCKSVSSLCTTRKLVIYNNKTVLPFFLAVLQFALLLVLLVHFLHMFTHTFELSFLYALCVCKCKLETETGLLVQMRALFFFVCFFCSKQPAVVPLTPPGEVLLFLLCTCHTAKTAAAVVAAGGRK